MRASLLLAASLCVASVAEPASLAPIGPGPIGPAPIGQAPTGPAPTGPAPGVARSSPREDAAATFAKKRLELRLAQSQRHLEYGLELRKQGLPTQSAAQIVLANEIGEGANPGATQVFAIMRQYDEAFWKRHGSRPSPKKVELYEKKARELADKDARELLELVDWAATRQCEAQATAICRELLLERGEPLECDAKGRILFGSGAIHAAISTKILAESVVINGKRYVRDELLAKLPDLAALHEVADAELLVRTTTSLEEAREIHALGKALLPRLAEELGALPGRRLPLYVFGKRAEYESLLDALSLSAHKIAMGVAPNRPFAALVSAEDVAVKREGAGAGEGPEGGTGESGGGDSGEVEIPEDAERSPTRTRLHGVCLHELVHLYSAAISRTAFPAWYEEGLADTYGGAGTFDWDGARLETGGLIDRARIEGLLVPGGRMTISDLFLTEALERWRKGKDAGLAFYAQSWAFLRYLRTGAGESVAARFRTWEDRCRGQVLGWELGRPSGSRVPANNLFLEMFGEELPKLEVGFAEWLKTL